MKGFEGRVALITGGSSGIGQATAWVFAREGSKIIIADISVDRGNALIQQIKDTGGDAIFIKTDVSQSAQVGAMIDNAVEVYGRLDCAFNNAGIEGDMASTADCTEENWDRTLSTNLKGVWLCMKYELRQMLRQNGGAIVNCASVAGLVGFQNLPAYVASKHGIVGLTKAAALEYAKTGIRVNAVCPGVIRTEMVERVTGGRPEVEAQYTALEPVGRLGTAQEVAEAVAWLCSDAASFVTGHAMAVDGGLVAQ